MIDLLEMLEMVVWTCWLASWVSVSVWCPVATCWQGVVVVLAFVLPALFNFSGSA